MATWADLQQKYSAGNAPQAPAASSTSFADLQAKYKNYTPPPPAAKPKTGILSSIFGAAKDFAKGARDTLGQPVLNVASTIQTGLDQTVGRGINLALGKGNKPTVENNALNPQSPAGQKAQAKINEPLGAAGTVGKVVGTVAPYLTGAGEDAEGASLATKVASKAMSLGKTFGIATAQTKDPVQGVETAAGGELLSGAAKVAGAGAKALYKAAIPTSAEEAGLLQTYKAANSLVDRVAAAIKGTSKAPITSAETAFNQGLKGTESMLGVQAKRASNKIWSSLIAPQLKASTAKVNMGDFFDEAAAKIKAENPELGRQGQLLEALDSFKDDYKDTSEATLGELQKFKEGWAKFIPEKVYRGKPVAGAANDVKDTLAGIARNKIYSALGDDVKQAYFDYGNLQGIKELGQKAMQGVKLRGGAGNFISGIKDMLLTPVATIGGKAVYRTAQGVEFLGAPGAKVISDILNEKNNAPTAPQGTATPPSQ